MKNSGYSSNSPGTVSGVFFSKKDADRVYRSLLAQGYTTDEISVLMSDETLTNIDNQPVVEVYPIVTEQEGTVLKKAKDAFLAVFVSITSLITLPGHGITISRNLLKKLRSAGFSGKDTDQEIGAQIVKNHTLSHSKNMKEGGIILSVDPKNAAEKRAIIQTFRNFNGHDILGDDGYTELG